MSWKMTKELFARLTWPILVNPVLDKSWSIHSQTSNDRNDSFHEKSVSWTPTFFGWVFFTKSSFFGSPSSANLKIKQVFFKFVHTLCSALWFHENSLDKVVMLC